MRCECDRQGYIVICSMPGLRHMCILFADSKYCSAADAIRDSTTRLEAIKQTHCCRFCCREKGLARVELAPMHMLQPNSSSTSTGTQPMSPE